MSECWGWLQLESKFFHVVKTREPFAVCEPSAVVMTHCFAATTQWPAVRTALELMRVPLHDPTCLPWESRRSIATLAGLEAGSIFTSPLPDELHAAKPPTLTMAPSTPIRNARWLMMIDILQRDGGPQCTGGASAHRAREAAA